MRMKKNVWMAFYLLFIVSVMLFCSLSYLKWIDIKKEHHVKYEHMTQMVSHSVHAMLDEEALMLEVLGQRLLENKSYKNPAKTTSLFDQLLKLNSYVVGYALVNPDGAVVQASSNVDASKLPNLLSNPKTSDDYELLMLSEKMLVGRPYKLELFNKWILPLRKSFRDKDGKVVGIITTAMLLHEKNGFFDRLNELDKASRIAVLQDFDKNNNMFRRYFSAAQELIIEDVYEKPVAPKVYLSVMKIIKDKYGISFDELRDSEKVVSFQVVGSWGIDKIAGFVFDKKYQLWSLVEIKTSVLWDTYKKIFLIYLSIFVSGMIIFFKLFQYIEISEKRKQDALLYQLMHNSLTGLPNRPYLDRNIDLVKKKFSKNVSMLYIDLDNFKHINDNFGHNIGDKLLIEVANRLQFFFSVKNLLLHQGGDEFVVLMQEEEDLQDSLDELIQMISRPYLIENIELNIGVSIGVAQYPEDTKNFEELIRLADIAMNQAKKQKNTYSLYSAKMKEENKYKTEIEQEFRNALYKNEVWMVYQPQICADGTLHGVEALVRWKNEKLGFVPPDQFISVVEEIGLMPQLGAFITKRSLDEIKALQDEMKMEFQLSINISVRQLIEVDFLKHFLDEIESSDFDKSLVTMEITENLLIEDIDYVLPLLNKIKDQGIKLSLDDFGTGYSSLCMLRKLAINELKIDKSFVDDILDVKEDKAMVESIIRMGKNLSMETLAEGVETVEQADMLRTFGCDIFQGYYFSKPLSRDDLLSFLQK